MGVARILFRIVVRLGYLGLVYYGVKNFAPDSAPDWQLPLWLDYAWMAASALAAFVLVTLPFALFLKRDADPTFLDIRHKTSGGTTFAGRKHETSASLYEDSPSTFENAAELLSAVFDMNRNVRMGEPGYLTNDDQLPNEFDLEMDRIIDGFNGLDADSRHGVLLELDIRNDDEGFRFTQYLPRAASRALRTRDHIFLMRGIWAAVIAFEEDDWRDVSVAYTTLHDAARHLGYDVKSAAHETSINFERARRYMIAARSQDYQKLSVYRLEETPDGPRYIWSPPLD